MYSLEGFVKITKFWTGLRPQPTCPPSHLGTMASTCPPSPAGGVQQYLKLGEPQQYTGSPLGDGGHGNPLDHFPQASMYPVQKPPSPITGGERGWGLAMGD